MRVGKHIFLGTAALVAGFVSLLCGSILLLSFLHGGSASNQGAFLMPEAAVAPPTAQELLQKKFEVYNTVTEEDGKSVVTIFSEEQIEDIRARRENGEWFWLSSEEMLYLINDTVKLFETYDIVYIRDLEGELKKYYGLSFFSSEEYYASFGGFDLGVTDASFDLKKDVYETILERVQVLTTFVIQDESLPDEFRDSLFIADLKNPLSAESQEKLSQFSLQYWEIFSQGDEPSKAALGENFSNGLFCFSDEEIIYLHTISNFEGSQILFPKSTDYPEKYDVKERTVIIELWSKSSQNMVTRLRFDDETNHDIVQHISALWEMHKKDILENEGIYDGTSQYRAVVYMNGIDSSRSTVLRYNPDGDINYFSFSHGEDVFKNNYLLCSGSFGIAEYINELLMEYLQTE